jgi:hypothetical protein
MVKANRQETTLTTLARLDFTQGLFKLLNETFEEGGNFYLEKGTALLETLDAITPEVASRQPWPGAPTIAAHCAHLDYYVRVNHAAIVGQEPETDWPSSWRVDSVGVVEWDALKTSLRSGYGDLMRSLSTLSWGEGSVCDSVAIVAHTAYHLGAIRQIRRLLAAESARDAQPNQLPE